MTDQKIRLSLSVTTADQEVVARSIEHFARTAAGLALEGTEAFIMVGPDDGEDEQT